MTDKCCILCEKQCTELFVVFFFFFGPLLLYILQAIFLAVFFIAADRLISFNTAFSSTFIKIYFLIGLLPYVTIYFISCSSLLQNLLMYFYLQ